MTDGHRGPVTVAAVQASYVLMDTQACLAKAIDLLGQAADLGARIVVFPEAFIPGTPIWIDSQRIWQGDEEWYALLVDQAVLVPGPVTDALGSPASLLRCVSDESAIPAFGGSQIQPIRRAVAQASCRLAAPSLLMALDR